MDSYNPSDSIADLTARAELGELGCLYCRAIDRRDPVLLATVFHSDAHIEYGTSFSGAAQEFVASLPKALSVFESTQHSIMNSIYIIDGDVAEGEVYFSSYHRTLSPEAVHMLVRGRYLDRYERRDYHWRIAQRWVVWDSYETRQVLAEEESAFDSLGRSGCSNADYSYLRLPMLGRGK